MERMERKQFTFYRSFYDAALEMNPEERAEFYTALCNRALNGIEPDISQLSKAVRIAWLLVIPVIRRSEQRALSGQRGGSSKKGKGDDASDGAIEADLGLDGQVFD